jgi:hypothetical protein
MFGNRRAERAGTLELHAWADNRPKAEQVRRGAMLATTWREEFGRFLTQLNSAAVYVTVDLDCLQAADAITNWENGRFTVDDVVWAIAQLRRAAPIVGGDVCGAFSPPVYARAGQRFVATIDHPHLPPRDLTLARKINRAAVEKLWPALTE